MKQFEQVAGGKTLENKSEVSMMCLNLGLLALKYFGEHRSSLLSSLHDQRHKQTVCSCFCPRFTEEGLKLIRVEKQIMLALHSPEILHIFHFKSSVFI